jgi:hypothetical protein
MLKLVLLLATSSAPLSGHSGDEIPRARPETFEKLEEWVDLEQGFPAGAREEAHRVIHEHLENGTPFSEAGLYMEVRRIVSLADNGHSNVDDEPIRTRFGQLPLRAYWFSDGPHVVRAVDRDLLGARLEALDGRPIDVLEERLMAYFGGTRECFRHSTESELLLCPTLLHAVGLAEDPDQLTLTLTKEERTWTVTLESGPGGPRVRPWRILNPAPIEGESTWAMVRADPPTWLQDVEEGFRYLNLADDLVYVQLRGNRDHRGQRIRDFASQTRERLEQDQPRWIVLDNRQNGGGDLTTTADFALDLPSYVQDGGRVYVLTGNGTFSAGIYTSFFPKASDPENTLVVGELVGDRPEFWAESRAPFVLTGTGYFIGYALQRHDLIHGCFVPGECHMAQHPERWNLVVDTLEPDRVVPTTYADFAAGRDPVLEWVLEDALGPR